jgi:ankyrin repeat protein
MMEKKTDPSDPNLKISDLQTLLKPRHRIPNQKLQSQNPKLCRWQAGNNPLMIATYVGNVEVVELLLNAGAPVNSQPQTVNQPLALYPGSPVNPQSFVMGRKNIL